MAEKVYKKAGAACNGWTRSLSTTRRTQLAQRLTQSTPPRLEASSVVLLAHAYHYSKHKRSSMPSPPPTHAVVKKQADPAPDSPNCDCAGCASVLDMLVRRELGEEDGDGIGMPQWEKEGKGAFSPSLVRRNARDGVVLTASQRVDIKANHPVDGSHSISRWWQGLTLVHFSAQLEPFLPH